MNTVALRKPLLTVRCQGIQKGIYCIPTILQSFHWIEEINEGMLILFYTIGSIHWSKSICDEDGRNRIEEPGYTVYNLYGASFSKIKTPISWLQWKYSYIAPRKLIWMFCNCRVNSAIHTVAEFSGGQIWPRTGFIWTKNFKPINRELASVRSIEER